MGIEIRNLRGDELDQMLARERLDRALHQLDECDLESLVAYVNTGRSVGGFLEAVISNDLADACGRADTRNRRRIFEWSQYLYNECPADCWGSKELYEKWMERGGLEGKKSGAI